MMHNGFLRHRLAAATSLLLGMGSLAAVSLAHAQTATYRFDIPAESLSEALRAVGRQAGKNVLFDPVLVEGKTAPALRSELTAEEAIKRLTLGVELTVESIAADTILLTKGTGNAPALPAVAAKPTAGSLPPQSELRLAQADEAAVIHEPSVAVTDNDTAAGRSVQLEEVVVTGSHIRGDISPSAVTTISNEDLKKGGFSTLGEAFRESPLSFGGGQQTTAAGAPGLANSSNYGRIDSANLHGLGSDSTLVLLNGQRLPVSGYMGAANINVVPPGLVDRIEILSDGASSIYGSDAVAGVVNIITKRDYSGLDVATDGGISSKGDAANYRFSTLGGTNWANGNLSASYTYNHEDKLLASNRDVALATLDPQTLQPQMFIQDGFASLRQELTRSVELSLNGNIHVNNFLDDEASVTSPGAQERGHDMQYGVSAALEAHLGAGWNANVGATYGRDHFDDGFTRSPTLAPYASVDNTNQTLNTEARADGPVFALPGGDVRAALGAGYRDERISDNQGINGGRKVKYGFGEISVPVIGAGNSMTGIHRITVNLSGRYEGYTKFGGQFSPKAGIVYQPSPTVTVRGSWGKSFHAPSLYNLLYPTAVYFYPLSDPQSPTGMTNALVRSLPNPDLLPEKATTWSTGIDFEVPFVTGLTLSATYFHVDYTDRIAVPISPDFLVALSDPQYAAFVIRNPTPAQQAAVIAQAASFTNYADVAYAPSLAGAIVDDRYQNLSTQIVHGVDLNASYRVPLRTGTLTLTTLASWLTQQQRYSPTSAQQTITGTVFNPPRFKARASASWEVYHWIFSGFLNHVSSEINNAVVPSEPVASWTTVDAQVALNLRLQSVGMRTARVALTVQNLFDREPPAIAAASTIVPGIGFDSTNASAMGRYLRLSLETQW